MATTLTKGKINVNKPSRKAGDLPVGVSMLTLSGFRICQMRSRQLVSASLLKPKPIH